MSRTGFHAARRRQENGVQIRRLGTIAIHAPRKFDKLRFHVGKVDHRHDHVMGIQLLDRSRATWYSVVDTNAMSF